MRCLKCGLEDLTAGTARCPSCNANIASLLYDVLPPGRELHQSKYRVDYTLGKGGFGITYKALLGATGGAVAIKEYCPQGIAPRDPETGHITVSIHDLPNFDRGLAIFRREAQILENVTHPNVVRIRDFFDENSTAYLVMEFLNGPTLRNIMREALPSEERIREIMTGIVSALATLHEKGIYHLDIKPGNVILEPERGAVLVDFGAARQGTTLSELSSLPQTKAYAPLEMIRPSRGETDAYGPETDLYELGVTLYEMLTGKLPPPADARAVGQVWDLDDLPEPWRTMVDVATKVEREERPRDIRAWWSLSNPSPTEEDPTISTEDRARLARRASGSSRRTEASTHPTWESGNSSPAFVPSVVSEAPSENFVSYDIPTPRPPSRQGIPGWAFSAVGLASVGVPAWVLFARPGGSATVIPTPAPVPTLIPSTPTPAIITSVGPSDEERSRASENLRKTLTGMDNPPEGEEAYRLYMDKLSVEAALAVERGADVSVRGKKGESILHLATYKDNTALAKACLETDATVVNAADVNGDTPLHYASLAPAPLVARLLLDNGANPASKNKTGETPLTLARHVQANEPNATYKEKREQVITLLKNATSTPLGGAPAPPGASPATP